MSRVLKKFSFYYRSQQQYVQASQLVSEILHDLKQKGIETYSVSMKSPQWNIKQLRDKMPKEKLGKKQYLATLTCHVGHLSVLPYSIEDKLLALNVEMVDRVPGKPRYADGDLVRTTIFIKSVTHFRKITSILNKKYGHGNWHFRNCKNILKRLRKAEIVQTGNLMRPGLRIYATDATAADEMKNGLKVDVVVVNTSDNADNLQRYLFQAQLMV